MIIDIGSLVGSWMNDSGFWIYSKMGGFSEVESLKTWTVLLSSVGVFSFLITMLFVLIIPQF